ncbi:hypothetical protein F5X68DRAFT_76779 [Plectosphaerella plurivora]|uniref:Uncharacterized protein n=1 Tax=Plectosphaerella plurivora TaxID=936078 RepID=A0A9P9ADX1_9PEZI|nr:hypothetical protein F5X68DRAFT_76779 [Plectosphaerella plurivora]
MPSLRGRGPRVSSEHTLLYWAKQGPGPPRRGATQCLAVPVCPASAEPGRSDATVETFYRSVPSLNHPISLPRLDAATAPTPPLPSLSSHLVTKISCSALQNAPSLARTCGIRDRPHPPRTCVTRPPCLWPLTCRDAPISRFQSVTSITLAAHGAGASRCCPLHSAPSALCFHQPTRPLPHTHCSPVRLIRSAQVQGSTASTQHQHQQPRHAGVGPSGRRRPSIPLIHGSPEEKEEEPEHASTAHGPVRGHTRPTARCPPPPLHLPPRVRPVLAGLISDICSPP